MNAARAGPVARVARILVGLVLGRLFRLRLDGAPPPTGPYVLIANHQGWADPFVLVALLPAEPRIHFMGDRQAVRSHWWKRIVIAAVGGLVLIDRTVALDRSAIAEALKVLEGGEMDGVLRMAAAGLGVAVVPGSVIDRGGPLVAVRLADPPLERTVGLAHRRDWTLSPAAVRFAALLAESSRGKRRS